MLYLRMHIALLHLHDGRVAQAKAIVIDEGKTALEALPSPDPSVAAAFHYVSSQYHKAKQDFAEFYKSGMLYLAYISQDTLPTETRRDLVGRFRLTLSNPL